MATLSTLPKRRGVTFKRLDEWPGYVIGSDGTVWEHAHKGWHMLRTTWQGRYAVVSLHISGSYAKCKLAELYEEAFDAPLPKISNRKNPPARPREQRGPSA